MNPQSPLTRRAWLSGAAGLAVLGGCARKSQPASAPPVSVVRAPAYDQRLYDTVRRVLQDHKLNVRGRRVLLKPNLVEFEPASTINTSPLLVHAVYEAVREMGAAEVHIGEGPGHRRNTLDLAQAAGYFQAVPKFEDVFVDLNLDAVTRVRPSRQVSHIQKLYLPNTALAADLLISIPKMKTHHWVGATLSMKNLFGLVPGGVYGWPKNMLHWAGINESIIDLHAAFPRQFAVVDGIIGMEGNGPIQGTPKPAGVLVAGRDVRAVDATCCRIMGIDPLKIAYLQPTSANDASLLARDIPQIGESLVSTMTPFQLIPEFQGIRLVNPA
jgi:uncharacterized protein (DUF362 family)